MRDHAQADDRGIPVRERDGALDDFGGSGARRRARRVLRWDRRVLLNLPREDVWRLASDTARFNRAVGLPPITFTPREDRGYGQLLAETRFFGIPLRWYEHPFNWVYQEHYSVLRSFVGTPIRSIRTSMRLRDQGPGRTMVDVRVEIVPRTLFGWLASRVLVGTKILHDGVRVLRGLEAAAASPVETYPRLDRPVVRASELRRLGERLRSAPVDSLLVDRLLTHVEEAPDDAVTAIRPFVLADRWGTSRRDTLRLCLHATRAGLLELSWEVLCPNCRVSKAQAHALKDVQATAHCQTCHIDFDANFDENVELRFAVSPAVRSASVAAFCIGGPGNARHVLAQHSIYPGAVREIGLWLREGSYRLRMPGLADRTRLKVTAGSSARYLDLAVDDAALRPRTAELAPGRVTLAVRNSGRQHRLLMVEEDAWSSQYASAALITTLQEFRDLFASEVLAPGFGLGVRNLTFLFTDVKGSTALYQSIGDAPAYARVRDHFAVLTEAIAAHDGALVKTIGDAVMAVFSSARCGVAAALAMHEGLRALNARDPQATPLHVKVGLHRGPCLACTGNGVLDYFGTTVNTAARLQGMAEADEVLVTPVVLEDAEVQELLASRNLCTVPFAAELRGLTGTVELHRLQPGPR